MPITEKNRYRYYNQRIPRCPLCDRNLSEVEWLWDEGRKHITCPHCCEVFQINVELEFRYSTDYDENIKEVATDE